MGPSGGKHGAVGPGLREGSGRLAAVCVHSLAENGIGHGLRECKGYCVRWDTVCNGILFAMGCCLQWDAVCDGIWCAAWQASAVALLCLPGCVTKQIVNVFQLLSAAGIIVEHDRKQMKSK